MPNHPPHAPSVSFGLPVRNEETCIPRCLDSILAQTFTDFEVVICDNASTDGTRKILEEYAARDSRVRLFINEEDIGQIENYNRVVRLSRGEYFRWIGANDWLERQYAACCVAALDKDPHAIAATTYIRFHGDRGYTRYDEYRGELLACDRPEKRFARMLWTFHAGDSVYDPIYSMLRREVLEKTALIRMMARADAMLAAELSLIGRFQHVPRCLAHRWKPYNKAADPAAVLRSYHPKRYAELPSSAWRLFRVLVTIIWGGPLATRQRLRCLWSAIIFFVKETWRRFRRKATTFRRGRLRLIQKHLAFLRQTIS